MNSCRYCIHLSIEKEPFDDINTLEINTKCSKFILKEKQ